MENKVYGKVVGKIVVPQEILAKVNGTFSRGVKEILLSEDGDFYFVLTDNSEVFLGNIKGAQGVPGPVGPIGPVGPQGYSPVKGKDYWTETDKKEIIEEASEGIVQGSDGFSPYVEIRDGENSTFVSITDVNGTQTFEVPDGTPGKDGYTPIKGVDYFDGEPGKDGEDYVLTQADKEEIAAMIPGGGGGGGSAEVTAESIKTALGYVPADEADIPEVPTKVSAFENDAGFITAKDIPVIPEVPVKSVNGKTGAVQLSYSDVGAEKAGEVAAHNIANDSHNDIRIVLNNAATTATEAKNLASNASQTATNASNKVDDLEGRMDSGEFKGEQGVAGTSVTVSNVSESSADGGNNVVTFSDGKTLTVKNGTKGAAGANGVSCTHSWNGTTLTVTSASGTSSANLKGDTGEQGPRGEKGDTGASGKSAFEYALEGGFTGTETEFMEKLATEKTEKVTGSGAITVTIEENKDYAYTSVTSLAMTAAAVNCRGFIGFGNSKPTINVTGFTASNGDDITSAAAGEVWEFSVLAFNGGAYIIWQKKGE